MTIRPYSQADAEILTAYYNELNTSAKITARELNSRLAVWRLTWVICIEAQPVGYACASPLPGLPGQYDLEMLIASACQRQGLGSQLVTFLKQTLTGSEVTSLSWGLSEAQNGTAAFLIQNGFVVEHEELMLACPPLTQLPLPAKRPDLSLHTYPRRKAIPLFCRLYDESFAPHAWHQPFTPDEVAGALVSARDLLFLVAEKRPFGFAWIHLDDTGEGRVEPMGVLPAGLGQGNGRFLFLSALHTLKHRGAHTITLGTWANNTVAMTLYDSLHFSRLQTITYYACPIPS